MFRRRLPLPPPRTLPWPLKPFDSATTSLTYDEFGRMVMSIRHEPLKGITPRMIAWWFGHIGGEMELEGRRVLKYHVWHPFDHIHWELARPGPDGKAGAGAQFRIVECFGRQPENYIDVIETVTKLDESGMTLLGRRLGQQVTRLNHDFIAIAGGTQYNSTLTVGTTVPVLGRITNRIMHRTIFPESKGRAWLKHNVEEVGLFEHLLPLLYPGDGAN